MWQQIWDDIAKIRDGSPLVMNITNYVVMNTTANALLALGASPVMSNAIEEVEEMVSLAHSLVINIGTLSTPWVDSMLVAGKAARSRGIPVIIDPVGSGATHYRTVAAKRLIHEIRPTVIRGNASEIRSLIAEGTITRGVDSRNTPEEILAEARTLSQSAECVVSVSGATDIIVEDDEVIRIENGAPIMTRVTGMGCTASAITGAFLAVNPSPLKAAAHAMALMGVAGELAATRCSGPGSFQVSFLDELHNISLDDLKKKTQLN